MLCEFANGVRGTFEASRTIVGPESQMAFDVHGTQGAAGWNLEKLNELRLYRLTEDPGSGYTTVFGGDRFPYHGNFVPGSANGIGFEDLVVIEDYEFCRSIAEERPHSPGLRGGGRVGQRAGGAAEVGAERALGARRLAEGGLMEATTTKAVRIGVIGAGRIGRMHAELLARQVPGAAVTAVQDADEDTARGVAGRARRRVARRRSQELLAARRRRGRDLHADRHPRRPDRRGRAGGQGDLLREAGVAGPRRGRPRAGRGAGGRRAVPDRLQPPLRPRARRGRGRRRRRDGRRAADRAHLQPRPGAAADRATCASSGGIFLDMTIHDFDMARFVAGSEVVEVFARGAVRVDPAFGEADDVDTAVVTLVHENGCLTTIDNSRQAVYGYDQRVEVFGSAGMAASENPLAHAAIVRTREGTRAATLPYFYLERYIPSYLREWEAFVARGRAAARRRRSAPSTRARRWSSAWPPGGRCARAGRCASRRSTAMSDPFADQRLDGRRCSSSPARPRAWAPRSRAAPPRSAPRASSSAAATASAARPCAELEHSARGAFVAADLADPDACRAVMRALRGALRAARRARQRRRA